MCRRSMGLRLAYRCVNSIMGSNYQSEEYGDLQL